MEEDLRDALVELTAPDGRSFQFRYGATIPYAGRDYVVLVELEKDPTGQEQILVTRVEEEDGQLSFVVAEEEDIVSTVFEKYLALSCNSSWTRRNAAAITTTVIAAGIITRTAIARKPNKCRRSPCGRQGERFLNCMQYAIQIFRKCTFPRGKTVVY